MGVICFCLQITKTFSTPEIRGFYCGIQPGIEIQILCKCSVHGEPGSGPLHETTAKELVGDKTKETVVVLVLNKAAAELFLIFESFFRQSDFLYEIHIGIHHGKPGKKNINRVFFQKIHHFGKILRLQ